MAIQNVLVQVADLAASLRFYRDALEGVVLTDADDGVVLDFVTTTIELRHGSGLGLHTWSSADANRGFRHLGIKVGSVDRLLAHTALLGIEALSRPIDLEAAGVRIAFLSDPDGTLVEVVEGHLQYEVIHDLEGARQERAMPSPERPRFDHIGYTVQSLDRAMARCSPRGFSRIGTLYNRWADFEMHFLRSPDTGLELFTFAEPRRPPVIDPQSRGFAGIEIDGPVPPSPVIAALSDHRQVRVDPDGMPVVELPDVAATG